METEPDSQDSPTTEIERVPTTTNVETPADPSLLPNTDVEGTATQPTIATTPTTIPTPPHH